MRYVITRVLPLPAPARIRTGPSVVSTASRCCGFSWSRKDNAEVAPESIYQFYSGIAADGIAGSRFQFRASQKGRHRCMLHVKFSPQAEPTLSFFPRNGIGNAP